MNVLDPKTLEDIANWIKLLTVGAGELTRFVAHMQENQQLTGIPLGEHSQAALDEAIAVINTLGIGSSPAAPGAVIDPVQYVKTLTPNT